MGMTIAIADIESNNLLLDATTIHCIAIKLIKDDNAEQTRVFTSRPVYGSDGDLTQAMEILKTVDKVVFHNGIKFDIPCINKLLGINLWDFTDVDDTLLMSQLAYPNLLIIDSNNSKLPPKLKGSHSLKAWGYRLGELKGVFGDGGLEEWATLTSDMVEYNRQDVEVTYKLYKRLLAKNIPDEALWLEYNFARIIQRQEQFGVWFDIKKAEQLHVKLIHEKEVATKSLHEVFTPLLLPDGKPTTPAKPYKRLGVSYNGTHQKIKLTQFNPSSRTHIAVWFKRWYGWKSPIQTENGNDKIDESVLLSLDFPEAKVLAHYFNVNKLLGQLAEGQQAWMKQVRRDTGRIHGSVNTIGAVSRRCTHCVPLTTKALTKDGWKGYDELSVGEYVLGYNLKTEKQEWTKVLDKHYFNNADVGVIGNKGNQLRCTADHKWVVMKRNRSELGYGSPRLVKASDIKHHDAILMNAEYDDYSSMLLNIPEKLPTSKYGGYSHMLDVLNYSKKELRAYLHGFLLADGYFKKSANGSLHSWSFAQAEGDILEASHLALYLFSDKRCSRSCKSPLKSDNQRFGYNITQTNKPFIRAKTGTFEWKYTNTEDVWCPTTELGTWVMKQEDGIITITGNSNPNMAQVPSSRAYMGHECRELFCVPPGKKMVGCDADALELRTLSHYMARYDGGSYGRTVDSGDKATGTDIHSVNQRAAGLPTRDASKTFIYALCYGAGAEKIGSIIGGDAKDGNKIKSRFYKRIPALKELTEGVVEAVKKNGYIKALDGNPYFIRSEHSALNTLLQGAGALVMKYWLIFVDRNLNAKYKQGVQYEFILNVHDEAQVECDEEIAEDVAKVMSDTFAEVTEYLKFRLPIRGSAAIGDNWSATH